MNYKKSILPLLLVGMLAACNSDEELIQTNPNYVEAGYGALTVMLTNPGGASTKAGETLEGVATSDEKKITSVAFFVQTQNEEDESGETMYGKFGSYFSTDEPLSASGLQEELTEVSEGEYTAKIRHKSDGWGDPKVIVIANYAENDLTDKLKGVQTWDALADLMTETLEANLETPLLMYASADIVQWKSGGSASASFELERLVSRIDIHNNAYNADTPDDGFVLESAQLIRPKTASYLLPQNLKTDKITVSDQPFPVKDDVTTDGNLQTLECLYAYENGNAAAEPVTATAVQVNGTFCGGKISKIVNFKKTVNGADEAIALARNTRYVININPAPDSTAITWDIQVKEWSEADTIKVKPKFPTPVLENIVAEGFEGGLSWDETTKTITTDGSGVATLTFETVGTTASIYKLGYKYAKDGSSLDTDELPIIKADDPIITYAAGVKTLFTINVPKPKKDSGVPIDVYVIIQNGGNTDACDTITIKCRPNYYDTSEKPVMMKDGKFWAPVNVGATSIPTSVTTTGDITPTCGNLFQWGRIYAFPASTDAVDTTSIGTTLGRPTQADLADMSKWNGKYIYRSDKNPDTKYNWLLINGVDQDNPGSSSMLAGEWYQKLWNSGTDATPVKTDYDPCPKGWRVPTLAEWQAIGAGNAAITKDWDDITKLMKIDGEDGVKLVLPAAGYRNSADGVSFKQGINGYYWSSSVPSSSIYASNVYFNSATLSIDTYYRGNGYSVRCIQE